MRGGCASILRRAGDARVVVGRGTSGVGVAGSGDKTASGGA